MEVIKVLEPTKFTICFSIINSNDKLVYPKINIIDNKLYFNFAVIIPSEDNKHTLREYHYTNKVNNILTGQIYICFNQGMGGFAFCATPDMCFVIIGTFSYVWQDKVPEL